MIVLSVTRNSFSCISHALPFDVFNNASTLFSTSILSGEALRHQTRFELDIRNAFLAMLKDSSVINQGSNLDFDIDIEKIDSAIKMAKGYDELLGSKSDTSKIVVRFNIDSFKNNYRISDLPMMELLFFAIKVGKTSINKMAIEDAISASVAIVSDKSQIDNPIFSVDSNCEVAEDEENIELDVYDVLLAGVREV